MKKNRFSIGRAVKKAFKKQMKFTSIGENVDSYYQDLGLMKLFVNNICKAYSPKITAAQIEKIPIKTTEDKFGKVSKEDKNKPLFDQPLQACLIMLIKDCSVAKKIKELL